MSSHSAAALALSCAALLLLSQHSGAQQPPPPPPPAATVPAQSSYRAPTLVVALPAPGQSVPQDKAVLVLRFGPGEQVDPIDLRSFVLTVDGVERTSAFQLSAAEA